jgi:hypothetical protein
MQILNKDRELRYGGHISAGYNRPLASLLTFCFLLLSATWTPAQVNTTDVVGKVIDSNGAVLGGATVVIQNLGTNDTRTVETNDSGEYVFNLLPIGRYSIRIEAKGFKAFSVPGVDLAVGDRARIDAQMEIGQITDSVEVQAPVVPALAADSSTIGTVVTQEAVQDLPLNGRNYMRLAQLSVGAQEGPPNALSSGTRPDDRRLTSTLLVNGQTTLVNNNLIDGMDNNERVIGTIGVRPSIDAIAEFRVESNLYTAEVGRTAGGVVTIITKSGTNNFHGSAFEFFRNDIFDARNFFAAQKSELRQNQFGGSIGGPIRKDKTFFFGDYEGFRLRQGTPFTTLVPTLAEREGIFTGVAQIYDPTNAKRTEFPNDIIPTNLINPIAKNFLALYPAPNANGVGYNFASSPLKTQNTSTFDTRVDNRFSDSDSFFARYSFNDVDTFTPAAFPSVDGILPNGGGSFPGPAKERAQSLQLNLLHALQSGILIEVSAGYLRSAIRSLPLNAGQNASQALGLPGANLGDADTAGLTSINLAGFTGLGDGGFLPLTQIDNSFQYGAAMTYARGSHNIKIGIGLIRRQFSIDQSANSRGSFTFNNFLTSLHNVGGNSVASFLLGYPSSVARSNSLDSPGYRSWEPNVYIQDDWRVKQWLTLNLGVRYDIFTPFTEVGNRISNFDPTTDSIVVAGQNGVSNTAGIATDFKDVAPRIGFAASVRPGLVIRGGFGLTYYPGNYTSVANLKNQPFNSSFAATSAGVSGGLPTVFLSAGLPLPVPTSATQPSGSIVAVAPDLVSTNVQQFNLMVEKEFHGNVISAGYVGELGRHVRTALGNIDQPLPGPGPIQPRRPFFSELPNISSISLVESGGTTAYHALQTTFERRLNRGLTLSANYTWSHSYGDAPDGDGGTTTAFGELTNNIAQNERGSNDFDIRHRAVVMLDYYLPFGGSLRGVERQVIQGWQVNAIGSWQTGYPFTVTNLTPLSNTGGADRPNRIANGTLANPTIAEWFDVTAFAPQAPFTVGDAGRNILYGPHQRHLDFSLFKEFRMTEGVRLQFRTEVFNITNTPNFAQPNAQLGSLAFGTITATQGNSTPRQLQFALKMLF